MLEECEVKQSTEKMLKLFTKLLLLISLIPFACCDDFLSKFHQNEYKVINYRVELKWFNKDLVNYYHVVTFKHNRTTAAINMTSNLKIDMDPKLDALSQIYKLSGNQYRVFPVRFLVNFWDATTSNIGGLSRMYDCGNIPPDHFLKKGVTYKTCNFVPDDTQMPPLMPTGQYMGEVTVLYRNQEVVKFVGYGEIFRPPV